MLQTEQRLNPFVHSLKKTKTAELHLQRAIFDAALQNSSHFAVNAYCPSVDLDGVDLLLRSEQNGVIIFAAIAVISGPSAVLHNGKMNSISAVARRHADAVSPYFLAIKSQHDDRFAIYDAATILSSKTRSLRPRAHEFMPAQEAVNSIISSVLRERL